MAEEKTQSDARAVISTNGRADGRRPGTPIKRGRTDVDQHDQRDAIVRDLIEGTKTIASMAIEYKLTQQQLYSYQRTKLQQLAAAHRRARELREADAFWSHFEVVIERANKMYDACHEYLLDPEDPGRYTLKPRAHEVEVIVEDENGNRETRNLADVLQAVEEGTGLNVVKLRTNAADPRKLLVETGRMLGDQLERLAKIQALMPSVQINVLESPVWTRLVYAIDSVMQRFPELQRPMAEALGTLADEEGI